MVRIVHGGLAVVASATLVAAACSAGKSGDDDVVSTSSTGAKGATGGAGGTTAATGGAGGLGQGGDLTGVGVGGQGGAGGTMGCAQFSVEAQAKPAAMMITLDQTPSMGGTKWNAAKFAVTTAMDKDVFDSMSLALTLFPSGVVGAPACLCSLFGLPAGCLTVSCATNGGPQIGLQLAGTNKSSAASGVRFEISSQMSVSGPDPAGLDDGSPIYAALSEGYAALKAFPGVDERIMLLITDGGFSCTSLSNPARPGYTDGACDDWEYPDSVNTLITANFTDATQPVRTFVVGVPDSDTNGGNIGAGCPGSPCFATPPYSMKLALSTYAVSGSPDTVDPACDNGAVFTQGGADPASPCHIDMTTGNFDANALANVIAGIRSNALGCVYPLPDPPPGESIDLARVNVEVTLDGNAAVTIPARSSQADDCALSACWDYDINGDIEILGAGCDDLTAATIAKVDIVVGCETIIN